MITFSAKRIQYFFDVKKNNALIGHIFKLVDGTFQYRPLNSKINQWSKPFETLEDCQEFVRENVK
jgi:hypothetical protein